ncbi:coactosin-like protein [Argiope bruennichi]|uniref:coactosin-like protein n=1 Tax=Argiope bruennichi TaxID=94029 RepID=UPI002494C57C|nr:coactosin-like protein [Argiope bruennichi]
MASAVDKEGVRDAYQDVRSDTSDTNWALFRYKGAEIVHDCSGENLQELKDALSDDERAFAFVRVFAGDEMSKRKKFVLLTWVGPSVSTLKRARVSIDKALVKQVVQNFAVELQIESPDELTDEYLRAAVDKVGGANYGTGTRT